MGDQSLADYLNEIHATSDTIQQGFRIYLAEQTNDLPTKEMESKLIQVAGTESEVRAALEKLEHSSTGLDEIARTYLSQAWDAPDQRDAIRKALKAGETKLPVIEVAIIAIAAMYGMYLLATGGKKSERVVHRRPDGSYEEHTVNWQDPASWPGAIVSVVTGHLPGAASGGSKTTVSKAKGKATGSKTT